MKFIRNGEPYIFTHKCKANEVGTQMNINEQKQMLVDNLLDIYGQCGTKAKRFQSPKKSFWNRLFGNNNIIYPDICIEDFHQGKGEKAYYYILPQNSNIIINKENVPCELKDSWIKVIYGSVFCMETHTPDVYIKGGSYASMYTSKALYPEQNNDNCTPIHSDQKLAKIFADAWVKLDIEPLYNIMDKDLHYDNDSVFDDMSSRAEYLTYLKSKFDIIRKLNSIKRVQLGRMGQDGDWMVVVKQILTNGEPIVCGLFIKTSKGLIKSISIREMDLPNF